MEKKTIFITGAASGIGRETAIFFADKGWFVGLFDLNEKGLKELAEEIGVENCCHQLTDVSDYESIQSAVELFAQKTNQKMNVLFNNAGIMKMGPFEQLSYQEHAKTIQVNIMGVINGIYASLDLLKNTPKSHIISMCSSSAFYGVPDLSTYSASKFFVRGLTEALNIEFEKYGITVTDLMPLFVATPMVDMQEYQTGTLRLFKAKLSAQDIAKIAWKAAHKNKIHWVPGILLKSLTFFGNLFPFINKPMMKLFNH